MIRKQLSLVWVSAMLLNAAVGAASASEYINTTDLQPASTGYRVTDDPSPGAPSAAEQQGPVRLARFSYVNGNVTWRSSDATDWSTATVNLPLRQGAQIWVTNGGRAEIQFDDGSMLRLGHGAVATLTTLFSDADGEYTEVQLNEGLAALSLRHAHSLYQINTPFASVKADGPAKVRVGVDSSVELAVREGTAFVEGDGGTATLHKGSYVDIASKSSSFNVASVPSADSWDRWNDDRDKFLTDSDNGKYLPSNIALVAGDLSESGTWRQDSQYGWVWCPRVVEADWRPYQHGTWTWVEPFGWTWVSTERWGWAPYHYGTWVHRGWGWAWVPGPVHQYWSPAVVNFCETDGIVGWTPLCPDEVRYPSILSVGYRSGDWSLYFSIGGCAVYYPTHERYCEPRPWHNWEINRRRYDRDVDRIYHNSTVGNYNNTYYNNNHFVPGNSKFGYVQTHRDSFGRSGDNTPGRGGDDFFKRGRGPGAPDHGSPYAGPVGVRPMPGSLTPSRTFDTTSRPNKEYTDRDIYRGTTPDRVTNWNPTRSTGNRDGNRDNGTRDNGNRGRDDHNTAGNDRRGDNGAVTLPARVPENKDSADRTGNWRPVPGPTTAPSGATPSPTPDRRNDGNGNQHRDDHNTGNGDHRTDSGGAMITPRAPANSDSVTRSGSWRTVPSPAPSSPPQATTPPSTSSTWNNDRRQPAQTTPTTSTRSDDRRDNDRRTSPAPTASPSTPTQSPAWNSGQRGAGSTTQPAPPAPAPSTNWNSGQRGVGSTWGTTQTPAPVKVDPPSTSPSSSSGQRGDSGGRGGSSSDRRSDSGMITPRAPMSSEPLARSSTSGSSTSSSDRSGSSSRSDSGSRGSDRGDRGGDGWQGGRNR
ncbi:MAG TPA: DUF6600 domain-containing protein [Capsulimonadaceae bacterium]|jgi:hypothetical protein